MLGNIKLGEACSLVVCGKFWGLLGMKIGPLSKRADMCPHGRVARAPLGIGHNIQGSMSK